MTDNQEPLSGQQMAALQRQLDNSVRFVKADVELRKYALEWACKINSDDPVATAKSMHEFLTAAAVEAKV